MADALHEEHHQNGVVFSAESPSTEPQPLPESIASPTVTKPRRGSVDKEAQEMVIESLRTQVQDLFSQVTQLNNKLVKSYDRVSDLEDDLHVSSSNLRNSTIKISQLEMERSQHLAALNTGLLVEKTHVTAELNRLMEKATEEAAQRGQAESARAAIEQDLDDLSATLFGQANTMVAEARYAKYLSERKVEEAETALKSAEEAVQLMQTQMQTMQAEREDAEKKALQAEVLMGKGKWVEKHHGGPVVERRLLGSHSQYQEFLSFLSHLRLLHVSSPTPPAMSTILPLPFLTRLLTEDSDPTVRLDLAPSLNWLSRRSVLAAIHSGQLSIEPISAASLFAESSSYQSTTVAGVNSNNDNISCALCGCSIFPTLETSTSSTPSHQHRSSTVPTHQSNNSTWSAGAFFRKPSLQIGLNGSQPSSPTTATPAARRTSLGTFLNSQSQTQIHIFRLASTSTSGAISSLSIPSLPKSSSQSNYNNSPNSSFTYPSFTGGSVAYPVNTSNAGNTAPPTTIYPLCMSGWCLARLRTTCILWSFVRTGIVEKVWEEQLAPPPLPPRHPSSISQHGNGDNANGPVRHPMERSSSSGAPPVPPRRRGLWGLASAIGERATSWGDSDKDKSKRSSANLTPAPPLPEKDRARRALPPPLAQPEAKSEAVVPVTDVEAPAWLPPAPPATEVSLPSKDVVGATATEPISGPSDHEPSAEAPPAPRSSTEHPTNAPSPPPLPKRSDVRSRTIHPVDASGPTAPPTPPRSPVRATHLRTPSRGGPSDAPVLPPRSHTPSSVPLPESRPGTPGNAAAAGASGVGGPSRTTSPAPVVAAPPPIPRRAAARTRVVAGAGADSDGTPAESQEKEKAGDAPAPEAEAPAPAPVASEPPISASKVEDEVKAEDQPEAGPEPVMDKAEAQSAPQVATLAAEEVVNGEAKEEETKDERILGAPVLPDRLLNASPSGSALDGEGTNGAEAGAEIPGNVDSSGADGQKPNGHGHVNGDVVTGKDEVEAEGDGAHVEAKAAKKVQEAKKKEEKDAKEKMDKEKGYIGDSTWEERTWKELVRLREDMFWARIGGLRE